jgi:hypothetical protein
MATFADDTGVVGTTNGYRHLAIINKEALLEPMFTTPIMQYRECYERQDVMLRDKSMSTKIVN